MCDSQNGSRFHLFRANCILIHSSTAPDLDTDFTWPSPDEIARVQQHALEQETPPSETTSINGLFINEKGAVWIPSTTQGQLIQLRICVGGGHRGGDTTLANAKKYFFWSKIRADVYNLVNSCLHCLGTTGGLQIPHPLAHALHASKSNELLHFDFLFMELRDSADQYVIILKDDASAFACLELYSAADAKHTVADFLGWFSLFGVVLTWCSDRGSHFTYIHEFSEATSARTSSPHHTLLSIVKKNSRNSVQGSFARLQSNSVGIQNVGKGMACRPSLTLEQFESFCSPQSG